MSGPPQQPPTPRRRSRGQRLVLLVGVLASLAALTGAVGGAYGAWSFGRFERVEVGLDEAHRDDPQNILIVGSDSREGIDRESANAGAFLGAGTAGRRSDSIAILRIDPQRKEARLLSLPRDLWVDIPGVGEQRINVAFSKGEEVLIDTIRAELGVPVNHYVEVDFVGFQKLVDTIDGVPMWFDRAMRDRHSGLDVLHPGCVVLDGAQALAFARSRHLEYMLRGVWRTDGSADLGRISRQQHLTRRAIDRARSKGLSNPVTLKRLVDNAAGAVTLDSAFSPADLLALGKRYSDFTGEGLATYTVPAIPFTTDGGASVLRLDPGPAEPVLNLFRDEVKVTAPKDLTEADVSVRVINGSQIDGHAANVIGALHGAGFVAAGTGNISDVGLELEPYTRVRFNPGDLAPASLVARHLPAGAVLVPDADIDPGVVEVITAPDLERVSAERLEAIVRPPTAPAASETTTTTTAPASTEPTAPPTTVPVGRVPGDPPPGETCG